MSHATYSPLTRRSTDSQNGYEFDATYARSPIKHTFEDKELDELDYELDSQDETSAILLEEIHNGVPTSRRRATKNDPLDDSPAAMVRRSVPETDDPMLPSFTFRVVVLGTVMCTLGASISQLFYFKSNAPSFSAYFVLLVSYPMGRWMARILPEWNVSLFGHFSFSLNPGPWSVKEHLLVVIIAQSGGSAYASDILAIQQLYYKQDIGMWAGLALILSTQLIGFGLAGTLQRILVKPIAMVFPQSLVYVDLYHSLHQASKATQEKLRLFALVFVACVIYQTFPTVLFPTLNSLAILCIIDNRNSVLRILGSGFNGLGMLDLSFDWSSVSLVGPLYTPIWAQCNIYAGLAGMMFVVMPILYFSDFWDATKFPGPVSAGLFNRAYQKFNVQSVLNSDFTLNEEAWSKARPLLLTPYFAITYGMSFAVLTSALMHVILWHSKDIKRAIKGSRNAHDEDNIHNRLMLAYPPVPPMWYIVCFSLSLLMAFVVIEMSPLQLPAWGLALAVCITFIFLVPVGIIFAVSGTTIGLNVITEFVAGFLIPGKPIANVVFKCYGYTAMQQAMSLTADLKLSVYMKVPPRHMFSAQVYGTIIGGIVNYFTLNSVIDSKRELLDGTRIDPTGQWTGRGPSIFYSASVIWGLVGPVRFFTGKYSILYWGFLIGIVVPVIPWYLHKKYPKLPFDKISIPLICNAATLPPQIPTNVITMSIATSYFFQGYLRRHRTEWFEKYRYVLSSALDAGTSVNALLVYLILALILGGWEAPHWWLNSAQDVEHCKPGS
ncbi:OPT oligopeptide transporter protein-domain-containing protein [Cantharellus anzutake]|uniref:OPT oligopeptide transporter protein-domain-containing protein n=1 Tax=Cantharellus anzutake TaxID=1750568 RepID=UPI00190678B0|nr:OPT oligopeptide transporter protein-domain-containing protein [Cantharellus anzutake]KAF8340507.1 OPT oligopeptide transporter protein-domain-containing protein [Cantharellus anzutake]